MIGKEENVAVWMEVGVPGGENIQQEVNLKKPIMAIVPNKFHKFIH